MVETAQAQQPQNFRIRNSTSHIFGMLLIQNSTVPYDIERNANKKMIINKYGTIMFMPVKLICTGTGTVLN
jgi:hypothetical protein